MGKLQNMNELLYYVRGFPPYNNVTKNKHRSFKVFNAVSFIARTVSINNKATPINLLLICNMQQNHKWHYCFINPLGVLG